MRTFPLQGVFFVGARIYICLLTHLETHCPKTTEMQIWEGQQDSVLCLSCALSPTGAGMNCP